MAELAARLEVTKLAAELGVPEGQIAFLDASPVEALRDLRAMVSAARYARHAASFKRVAALSKVLPTTVIAKMAQVAIGPFLSARIAAFMDAGEAVALTSRLPAEFLTEVSGHLEPERAAEIIRALPDDLVVDVGRRLLDRGEHITLARFVSVVGTETSLAVVEDASAADLYRVTLFIEDANALEAVVERLDDERIGAVLQAAADAGTGEDAIELLSGLSPAARDRVLHLVEATT